MSRKALSELSEIKLLKSKSFPREIESISLDNINNDLCENHIPEEKR